MPDIKVDIGQHYFNLRVGAVIEQDGALLINRLAAQTYWFLPGGRVASGETTRAALRRELREELGIEVAAMRTLFVVESFFGLDGRNFHELCFYALVAPQPAFDTLDAFWVEGGGTEFRFVPKADLSGYDFRPDFLVDRLMTLPRTVEHIIQE